MLLLFGFVLPVGSFTVDRAEAQDPSSKNADQRPIVLVLDASGSMLADDAGGQKRIDAAKDATRQLIDGLAEDQKFGVVIYGTGTSSDDADKERGCQDVTILRPLATGDKQKAVDSVNGIQPRGWTPIGKALQQAADLLPDNKGTVVLVSGGEDTCAPPPVCEVAKDLVAKGIDVKVNTIGLNINDQGRSELQCIAQSTGGVYADANDAASLSKQLSAATRDVAGATYAGEPIAGKDWTAPRSTVDLKDRTSEQTFGDAPEAVPGTMAEPKIYTDEVPPVPEGVNLNPVGDDRGSQYRSYKVWLNKGDTLVVGFLAPRRPLPGDAHPDDRAAVLETTVTENALSDKGGWFEQSGSNVDIDPSYFLSTIPSSSQTFHAGADGFYGVSVRKSGGMEFASDSVPFMLALAAFHDVENADSAPPKRLDPMVVRVGPDSSPFVAGGTDPANAPLVEPGTVTTDIAPGEVRYYRVRLGWGQSYAAVAQPLSGPESESEKISQVLKLHTFSPDFSYSSSTGGIKVTDEGPDAAGTQPRSVVGPEAVQLDATLGVKKTSSNDYEAFPSHPGEQIIAVTKGTNQDSLQQHGLDVGQGNVQPQRFRLAVAGEGEEITPGPVFTPIKSRDGSSEPNTGHAQPSDAAKDAAKDAAAESSPMSQKMPLLIGGGVIILVVIGALVAFGVRRKQ